MGILDITIGQEDQQQLVGAVTFVAGAALTATGVGAGVGIGMMVGGAGMVASGEVAKNQAAHQRTALKTQERAIERERYESLLRQVSAEIQADQTMLASLNQDSNNSNKNPSVSTQQNQEVGSPTSGTF